MKKSLITIKIDKIGVMPENVEKLILGEIKNIIKKTDMSNLENKKERTRSSLI